MKKTLAAAIAIVCLAGSAFAEDKAAAAGAPPAGMPDMSKMGPWTRKPTSEKATKKEILAAIAEQDELGKKHDFDGMLAYVDFPVYMITDEAKGNIEAAAWNKEQYTAIMKPMCESMPKDMKVTHKPSINVLSDSLASVVDDYSMTMGKTKMGGRNAGLLVKKDGKWKWKMMSEAGWGGMAPPAGAAPAAAPAAAPKK